MKLIYLDQFAISNIADSLKDEGKEDWKEDWRNFSFILIKLISEGKVRCYTSIDTILETSRRHEKGISNNTSFIEKYIDKTYIKNDLDIICMEINSIIKGVIYNFDDYLTQCTDYDISQVKLKVEKEKECIEKECIETITGSDTKDIINKYKDILSEIIYKNEVNERIDDIDRFIKDRTLKSPYWYKVLSKLRDEIGFSVSDFEKLKKQLEDNQFKNIPILQIKAKLDAYKMINQSAFFNDRIDLRRIASSLPHFDIALYDTSWCNCIRLLELDKEYNTSVYTGKLEDIRQLRDVLRAIEDKNSSLFQ